MITVWPKTAVLLIHEQRSTDKMVCDVSLHLQSGIIWAIGDTCFLTWLFHLFFFIQGDSIANSANRRQYLSGQRFSTWDQDQDSSPNYNCAERWHGAWWFNNCFHGHLNGRYVPGGETSGWQGILWNTWMGSAYSLKRTEMKIRPNH